MLNHEEISQSQFSKKYTKDSMGFYTQEASLLHDLSKMIDNLDQVSKNLNQENKNHSLLIEELQNRVNTLEQKNRSLKKKLSALEALQNET